MNLKKQWLISGRLVIMLSWVLLVSWPVSVRAANDFFPWSWLSNWFSGTTDPSDQVGATQSAGAGSGPVIPGDIGQPDSALPDVRNSEDKTQAFVYFKVELKCVSGNPEIGNVNVDRGNLPFPRIGPHKKIFNNQTVFELNNDEKKYYLMDPFYLGPNPEYQRYVLQAYNDKFLNLRLLDEIQFDVPYNNQACDGMAPYAFIEIQNPKSLDTDQYIHYLHLKKLTAANLYDPSRALPPTGGLFRGVYFLDRSLPIDLAVINIENYFTNRPFPNNNTVCVNAFNLFKSNYGDNRIIKTSSINPDQVVVKSFCKAGWHKEGGLETVATSITPINNDQDRLQWYRALPPNCSIQSAGASNTVDWTKILPRATNECDLGSNCVGICQNGAETYCTVTHSSPNPGKQTWKCYRNGTPITSCVLDDAFEVLYTQKCSSVSNPLGRFSCLVNYVNLHPNDINCDLSNRICENLPYSFKEPNTSDASRLIVGNTKFDKDATKTVHVGSFTSPYDTEYTKLQIRAAAVIGSPLGIAKDEKYCRAIFTR